MGERAASNKRAAQQRNSVPHKLSNQKSKKLGFGYRANPVDAPVFAQRKHPEDFIDGTAGTVYADSDNLARRSTGLGTEPFGSALLR